MKCDRCGRSAHTPEGGLMACIFCGKYFCLRRVWTAPDVLSRPCYDLHAGEEHQAKVRA